MKKMILMMSFAIANIYAAVEVYDQPQNGRLLRLAEIHQLTPVEEYVRVQDKQTKMFGYIKKNEYDQALNQSYQAMSPQAAKINQSQVDANRQMQLIRQSINNRRAQLNQWLKHEQLVKR